MYIIIKWAMICLWWHWHHWIYRSGCWCYPLGLPAALLSSMSNRTRIKTWCHWSSYVYVILGFDHCLQASPSMSSFSVEEFVGDGFLKQLVPRLLEEGWDDVPTLKLMNSEDMDALNMTQQQRVTFYYLTYLYLWWLNHTQKKKHS